MEICLAAEKFVPGKIKAFPSPNVSGEFVELVKFMMTGPDPSLTNHAFH